MSGSDLLCCMVRGDQVVIERRSNEMPPKAGSSKVAELPKAILLHYTPSASAISSRYQAAIVFLLSSSLRTQPYPTPCTSLLISLTLHLSLLDICHVLASTA